MRPPSLQCYLLQCYTQVPSQPSKQTLFYLYSSQGFYGIYLQVFFRSQFNIFLTESWETLKGGRDGFSLVNVKYKVSIDSLMSSRQHRTSTKIYLEVYSIHSTNCLPISGPQIIMRLKCRSFKITRTEQGRTFI